jgi:hypothetical protein
VPHHPLPTTYDELLDLLPAWGGTAHDRRLILRVMVARDAFAVAEEELREAVGAAYDGGDSWRTIGTVLGISRQAAQQRFRRPE